MLTTRLVSLAPRTSKVLKAPQGIEAIHLGAWNDHPRLVDALEERIITAMTRSGS